MASIILLFIQSREGIGQVRQKTYAKMPTKTIKSLNPWKLAQLFQEAHPNLYYDPIQKLFYNYSEELFIWIPLTDVTLKSKVLTWIEVTYPKDYTKFLPHSTTDILILLQRREFDLTKVKVELGKEGFLLPFKNGVLNCRTLELMPHSKEHYSTHIIGVEFTPENSLKNTAMAEFLACLVNNNPYALNILRACLYLIFTNTTNYQVALYIHGPGGTGKSTFTNILLYLFGTSASLSTSLNMISSRFGSNLLKNKLLLIINELPLLLGSEPSILKAIIGGDAITGEEKYKTATQFIPKLFVIITSNSLWNLKNVTSAMARRFIYLPFTNKPINKNKDLFNLNGEGSATGELVLHLPALIQWALKCPQAYIDELNVGGDKITENLSPDSQLRTNPLKVWALENLESAPIIAGEAISQLPLGGHKKDINTLYGNYVAWAAKYANEIGDVKSHQFSSLLIDNLTNLGWVVNKKRFTTGTVIQGIKFSKEGNLNTFNQESNSQLPFSNLDFNF